MNAWTMMPDATVMMAHVRKSAPTPESMSAFEPRRAPATHSEAAYMHTTNAASNSREPSEAMGLFDCAACGSADRAPARTAAQTPGLFGAADPGFASYFDGHFAITPLGSAAKPWGTSVPCSTPAASSLSVSGTMPV